MVELVKKDVGKGQSLKLAASFVKLTATSNHAKQLHTAYLLH